MGERDRHKDDDSAIRFLLAGGRLAGADHDRILARIRRAAAPRRRLGWWLAGFGATLSAAAAALVLGVGLRHAAREGDAGALTAKGLPGGAGLEARCPGRPRGSCRIGDKLIFEVEGATEGGLLAAFAESASGEKIWYFPTREGRLAQVPASAGTSIVGEAARIGDEHATGRYTLHLYVLDRPVDRATLAAGKAHARAERAQPLEVDR
jgi:hypothetical protein